MYKSIFIDLDDTVWAFSENARDTFQDMYNRYHFERYFDSFDHFYTLYSERNAQLWIEYRERRITKDELNEQRFLFPLLQVGVDDKVLAKSYSDDFFSEVIYKTKVMPHAKEALAYLASKYRLYILSNGFRELQEQKMRSAGVDAYFKKVILSEDIGAHKPYPQIFHFALSATQSEVRTSLMIGDNWDNDIAGAKGVGIDQVYYNMERREKFSFRPTHIINDWREIISIL